MFQFIGHGFQHRNDAIVALQFNLVHAAGNFGKIGIAFGAEPFAQRFVFDRDGGFFVVNRVKLPCGQAGLCNCALPCANHLFGIVVFGGGINLVQHIDEFRSVGAFYRVCDQMFQRVLHGTRFRVACIKEHQHQIGQINDVIGDAQGRGALIVSIKAGAVDDDLVLDCILVGGAQLQVAFDMLALALRYFFDLVADPVEWKARVGIQCGAGQGLIGGCACRAVADHSEFVIHCLVAGALQFVPDVGVDKGGFARRKCAQHRNQRPPRYARGQRRFTVQQAGFVKQFVKLVIGRQNFQQGRVFGL